MPATALTEQLARDSRSDRRAFAIATVLMLAAGLVNATSILLEAERLGQAIDGRLPWLFEFSSIGVLIALFPAVAVFSRRVPITPDTWRRAVPAHVLASVVFSAVHVGGMVAIRKLAYPAMVGEPYLFFAGPAGGVLRESLYEYRKDVLVYTVFVLVLHLSRSLAEYKREAAAARADARRTGRLTLKCGGRTIWLKAGAVDWAQAAGNYVEVRADGGTHLARMSLNALTAQLAEAGVDVARVHRSYLVNRDRIAEIAPNGDGDVRITMTDGAVIPGSRRYRDRLPAAGATVAGLPGAG